MEGCISIFCSRSCFIFSQNYFCSSASSISKSKALDDESFANLCFACKNSNNVSLGKKLFQLLKEKKETNQFINYQSFNLLVQIFKNGNKIEEIMDIFNFTTDQNIPFNQYDVLYILKYFSKTRNKKFGLKFANYLNQSIHDNKLDHKSLNKEKNL